MEWLKVRIFTKNDQLDELTMFLSDLHIESIEIQDSADFIDFLQSKSFYWDYIDESLMQLKNVTDNVTIYLDNDRHGQSVVDTIKLRYPNLETSTVSDSDWENEWKKYFKPMEIGDRLVVRPSWEQYENMENRNTVIIDPGNSFGTGTHESTYLCLVESEKTVKGNEHVLDLGSGTGILGISALALGAKNCVFVDMDATSIKTATKNVEINGFKDKAFFFTGDITRKDDIRHELSTLFQYDVIFANIVPDVIIATLPYIYTVLAQNGSVICSGIITERANQVEECMKSTGYKDIESREMNGWVVMTGRK